ncbi:hypothetical protein LO763_22285 [Glycomyces sp. A-F 0318]|uniref:hypothetical protein n=1 Tax=Glycomyces amatae TaxID=2881355 RepID=UPI001E4BFD2B|nr:hypothetical protein [Glycomyces amatae]MCD0446347.1 hypothetical protein [Glycomyces amatae]
MQRTFPADDLRVLDEATRTDVTRISTEHGRHPAAVLRALIRSGITQHAVTPADTAAALHRLTAYLAAHEWTPSVTAHHESAAAVHMWHHRVNDAAAAVPATADAGTFADLYRACVEQVAATEARPISELAADLARDTVHVRNA